MQSKLLFAIITVIAIFVAQPIAVASWMNDWFNPKPLRDDFVLPMPCNGSMAWRPVMVPAPVFPDDRRVLIGGIDKDQGYKENQHPDFISGAFLSPGSHDQHVYYIGKYEVTRRQFAAARGECGASADKDGNLPITGVTWLEAMTFANTYSTWLIANTTGGVIMPDGQTGFVRLPTEVEWEFAARGGAAVSEGEFAAPLPPIAGPLARHAWFGGSESSNNRLQAIGLLDANPLGIHDMLGNASELVFDLFRLNRLSRMHGGVGGFVVRGGSYLTAPTDIRSSWRQEFAPYTAQGERRDKTVGFRVVVASPLLPTPQRLRAARDQWTALAQNGGGTGGLGEAQMDPLQEVRTLAQAVEDPQMKLRLERLGLVIAANIKTRNDQRDRAVRATLEFATGIAAELRKMLTTILAIEDSTSLDREKVHYTKQAAALRDRAAYYRDTLQHLLSDYSDRLLHDQAELLSQELGQRLPARARLVNSVLHDIEVYRTEGDLPAAKLEADIRRELCNGPPPQLFPVACHPSTPSP